MGTILLNEINYSGGGSGGSGAVSYGTSAPTASMGSDGSLYIQVDAQQIVNIWINVNGDWLPYGKTATYKQLDFDVDDHYSKGAYTYVADKAQRVIAINTEVIRNKSNDTVTTAIATTGTVVDTLTNSDTSLSQYATQQTVSIINLDVGDTITMTNTTGLTAENYSRQYHIIVSTPNNIQELTLVDYKANKDSNSIVTYNTNSAYTYLVTNIDMSGSANASPLATITTNGNTETYDNNSYTSYATASKHEYCNVAVIDEAISIILTRNGTNAWCGELATIYTIL